MERNVDRDSLGFDLRLRESLFEWPYVRFPPCNHRRIRTIDGRHLDVAPAFQKPLPRALLIQVHDQHHALAGLRTQKPAPGADHPDCCVQVEHAGHVGGGNLTHTVAHNRVRKHAPVHPKARQAYLLCE